MCTIRRIISNQEKILAWLGMIIIKVVKKKKKPTKNHVPDSGYILKVHDSLLTVWMAKS